MDPSPLEIAVAMLRFLEREGTSEHGSRERQAHYARIASAAALTSIAQSLADWRETEHVDAERDQVRLERVFAGYAMAGEE